MSPGWSTRVAAIVKIYLLVLLVTGIVVSVLQDPLLSVGDIGRGYSVGVMTIVSQPNVTVEKLVQWGSTLSDRISVDAYDRLHFFVNITNVGTADAYNVTVVDYLNQMNPGQWAANFTLVSVQYSNGTVLNNGKDFILVVEPSYSSPDNFTFSMYEPIPPGMSVYINFTVEVYWNVTTGTRYHNYIYVTKYSNVSNGQNLVDPANMPNDTVRVAAKAAKIVRKSVVWSQEDFTGSVYTGFSEPNVVTIGEVLIYEIRVRIPEGFTDELVIEDWLPALYNSSSGYWDIILVEYLNESNITVDDPGVSASNATLVNGVWTSITGDRMYPNIVRFWLGDVQNTNNDTDPEIVTIRLKAIVLNMPNNTAGAWPWNGAVSAFYDANSTWRCPQCSHPKSDVVYVHEPNLTVTKTANTSTIDPLGTGVKFNISIVNQNTPYSSPAFDVNVVDDIPEGLELVPSSIQVILVNSTGTFTIPFNDYSTGDMLNISIILPRGLLPGERLEVVYDTVIDPDDLLHGSILYNNAKVTASTLPGPNGTGNYTPGDPGTLFGERVYILDSNISISSLPLLMDKSVDKTVATIGENITYTINVTVPIGTSLNVTIVDQLDHNTQFVSVDSCTIIGTGVTVEHCPPIASLSGSNLTLTLGSVTKVTPGYAYIIINYTVQVKNDTTIVAGTVIRNNATLYYDMGVAGPDFTIVTILEPNITIIKTVNPSYINNTSPVTQFNITIHNQPGPYTSPAYDLVLTDLVPAGLMVLSATYTQSGAAGVTLLWSGNNITLLVDELDVDGYINVTITVTAYSGTPVNSTINNTASVTYTSLPGDVPGERNYTASAWAQVAYTAPFNASKTVDDVIPDLHTRSDYIMAPPGAIVEYTVNITIPLGTTPEVNILDTLDPRLTIIPGTITVTTGPGASYSSYAITSTTPLNMTIYNVSSTSTWSYILVTYQAQVSNTTSMGEIIENNATVTTRDGLNDTHSTRDYATIEIGEPDLRKSDKYFSPDIFFHTYPYTVLYIYVTNNGTMPAYDVVVEDVVPSTLLVLNATIQSQSGAVNPVVTQTGNNVTLTIDQLDPSGYVLVEVWVRAYALTPWNSTTVNNATVEWTSLPGPIYGEKNYNTEITGSVFYDPVLTGSKAMEPQGQFAWVGSLVEATINIVVPTGNTTNLTLIDTWDPAMSIVGTPTVTYPANISVEAVNITIIGNTLVINFGGVSNNDTIPLNITVTFYLRIDYVPQNMSYVDLVYWNNATIQWSDDGLLVNRSLLTTAIVKIPPIIGGEATLATPRSLGTLLIGIGLLALGAAYTIASRRR